MEDTITRFLVYFVIIILVIFLIKALTKESFQRFGGPPMVYSCEFNRECLYDNARTIAMSNGMEGVCTTHGLACPSFMLDQNQFFGNDNSVTPDEYQNILNNF